MPRTTDKRIGANGFRGPAGWDHPLIGREEHRRAIARARAATGDSAPVGAVIVGAAGVGKSHLARAALADAKADGASTLSIHATRAASGLAFGAFAHLLPPDGAELDPLHQLNATTAAVRRDAAGRPLTLLVDDAERLDPLSAALVHQLATTRTAFVIVTLTTSERAADAIVALWKEGLALRIDLAPLARDAVGELCRQVLGGEIEQGTLHRPNEVTRGNPLFLLELLDDGRERGALTGHEGIWRWRGSFGAPPRLRDWVDQRLSELDERGHRGLDLLAFGEPIDLELLDALAGPKVIAQLDSLGLVAAQDERGRTFATMAEPLVGEVRRASVTSIRARAIQRELADAVERSELAEIHDREQRARWRLEGGGAADPDTMVEAALFAEAKFDFELSARLATLAIDNGAGVLGHRTLATALRGQGRAAEAEQVWARLQETTRTEVDLVDIVFGRSMNLLFSLGSAAGANRVIDEAEPLLTTESARDAVTTQRGLIALYAGRPVDALAVTEPVLRAPGQTSTNMVYAAVTVGPALASVGRTAEAHAVIDEALHLAFALPEPGNEAGEGTQLAGLLLASKFLAFQVAGDITEAHDLAETTHSLAIEVKSHDGVAALGCALGLSHLSAGRARSAVLCLREAAVLLRDFDRNRYLPWCLAALAHAQALLGQHEAAETALRDSDMMANPDLVLFAHEVERARACVAAARGELDRACAVLLAAADAAETAGQLGFAVPLLHDVVRLGRCDASLVARLRSLAARTDASAAQRATAHAEALLDHDGEALERVAAGFEAAGAVLAAAEVLASASAIHRGAGRADHATLVAERARELLARCEGARPPGFTLLTADAPALTPREREIATLAAEGLTSRAIAERLFLSVRTVDNHLYRAYDKLRVRNRRELALLLEGS